MIESARRVVAIVDSSKLGNEQLFGFAGARRDRRAGHRRPRRPTPRSRRSRRTASRSAVPDAAAARAPAWRRSPWPWRPKPPSSFVRGPVTGRSCGRRAPPPTSSRRPTWRASELIRSRLAAATPSSGFVGEEGGSTDAAAAPAVGRRPARRHGQLLVRPSGARREHRRGHRRGRPRRGGRRRPTRRRVLGRRGWRRPAQRRADHRVARAPTSVRRWSPPASRTAPQCVPLRATSSAASCRWCATCAASDRRRCRCAGWRVRRTDSYFERDTKVWDYAAASLVAAEAGAVVELPCPENRGLAIAAAPAVFDSLRRLVDDDRLISPSRRRPAGAPRRATDRRARRWRHLRRCGRSPSRRANGRADPRRGRRGRRGRRRRAAGAARRSPPAR